MSIIHRQTNVPRVVETPDSLECSVKDQDSFARAFNRWCERRGVHNGHWRNTHHVFGRSKAKKPTLA